MLSRTGRWLFGIAAVLLVGLYFVPLWSVTLSAPQYPEGLGMRIWLDAITGVKENDLNSINNLNHYIGMKRIEPDSIPELRFMSVIVGVLVAAAMMVCLSGRRVLAKVWLGAFVVLAVAGLVDFYRWGYDYGHDLDQENAIIKVPGMTYQPPLIGSKKLLNFTATSLPAAGTLLATLAMGLGVAALFVSRSASSRDARRRPRGHASAQPAVAVPFMIAMVVSSCAATGGTGKTTEACGNCTSLDHATHQPDHSAHAAQAKAPTPAPTGALGALGSRIAAAPAYSRIVVAAGVYVEPTLVITRPLQLVGEPGAILDGEGARTVLHVQADDVTVSGFTIRNTGASQVEERAGIRVSGVRGCRIEKNLFVETAFGVYLEKTTRCVVQGNALQGTGATQSRNGNGIHAWSSDHVTVSENEIGGHRDGVYFEFVSHGHVHGNLSARNSRYGLHFMFSDDSEYESNTYRENGNGVAVMYSSRVGMWNNTFDRNLGGAAYGLLLKDINESTIIGNEFTTNTVGLHLEGASRNRILRNGFTGNGVALRLLANAQDNVLEHNDFVGNAFDVATNSRASYSTLRGNFWDRYKGYDLDRDGIGDVPHAPVTLFGLVVEQTPAALVLLRSPFVGLLDLAERAFPSLTPALRDEAPRLTARGT